MSSTSVSPKASMPLTSVQLRGVVRRRARLVLSWSTPGMTRAQRMGAWLTKEGMMSQRIRMLICHLWRRYSVVLVTGVAPRPLCAVEFVVSFRGSCWGPAGSLGSELQSAFQCVRRLFRLQEAFWAVSGWRLWRSQTAVQGMAFEGANTSGWGQKCSPRSCARNSTSEGAASD